MDLTKLHGKFPWITKEGYFDPGKFPIDSALKQALSDNDQEFRSGLNLLHSMYNHGRKRGSSSWVCSCTVRTTGRSESVSLRR